MVNSPKHYMASPSGIEVIQLTEHMNFCLGNAVKYIMRCDHKGRSIEDLRKAVWYIQREIRRRELAAQANANHIKKNDPVDL
jgi:translation initiation factor 2B subunit (eIF-2B alpha/beta/delta family)